MIVKVQSIVTGSVVAVITYFINLILNKQFKQGDNSFVEKIVRIENKVFYQSQRSHVYVLRYFQALSIFFVIVSALIFFDFLWNLSFYLQLFKFFLWLLLIFVSIKLGVVASRNNFGYLIFNASQILFSMVSLAGISEIEKLKHALIIIDGARGIASPAYFYYHGGLINGYLFLRHWYGTHYGFPYHGVDFSLWYVIQNSSIAMALMAFLFLVNVVSQFYFDEELRTRVVFMNVILALVIGGLAGYPEIYYFLFVK